MTTVTFRWLLALLALLAPTAFSHRSAQAAAGPASGTARVQPNAETVFRHYV